MVIRDMSPSYSANTILLYLSVEACHGFGSNGGILGLDLKR